MKEFYLPQCPSTQEYLKNYLAENGAENSNEKEVLVATQNQTKGIGRGSNTWDFFPNSLAFSFTLSGQKEITLTSLEIGVLLCQFFQEKYKIPLHLKWPNDLFTKDKKKCGGIIIHIQNSNTMIVGIGINLQQKNQNHAATSKVDVSTYKNPLGFVELENLSSDSWKDLPKEIYEFIYKHRINPDEITKIWDGFCIHKNTPVVFAENHHEIKGIFKGVGSKGEALIMNQETQEIGRYYSGHLTIT